MRARHSKLTSRLHHASPSRRYNLPVTLVCAPKISMISLWYLLNTNTYLAMLF